MAYHRVSIHFVILFSSRVSHTSFHHPPFSTPILYPNQSVPFRVPRPQRLTHSKKWLVARDDPRYLDPQTTFQPYGNPAVLTRPGSQQQQPYGNHGIYPVPPPVYDPDAPRPPMYPGPPPTMAMAMAQPPDGATKVDPMQQAPVLPPVSTTVPPTSGTGGDGNERYEAPPGPPPSIQAQAQTQAQAPIRQQGTGGTNPFRD